MTMTESPEFELEAAHRHFSVLCFNEAWALLERPQRTPEEDEAMLRLSLASLWHWTQRPDYEPTNLSIGYWHTSRVCAALDRADEARRYARLCVDVSRTPDVPLVFLGYAYEVLARAESVAGNHTQRDEYLSVARRTAGALPDSSEREQLLADLTTIPGGEA
jgi:hypothetical protein